jgi:hypothetical protein
VARGGVGNQMKAGAVRKPKPKPKDDSGIGMHNDGSLNVVAPGDLVRPLGRAPAFRLPDRVRKRERASLYRNKRCNIPV